VAGFCEHDNEHSGSIKFLGGVMSDRNFTPMQNIGPNYSVVYATRLHGGMTQKSAI
jgi:hypothetical protein